MRNRKVVIVMLGMLLITGLAVLSAFKKVDSSWAFAISAMAGLYFGANVAQKGVLKDE